MTTLVILASLALVADKVACILLLCHKLLAPQRKEDPCQS